MQIGIVVQDGFFGSAVAAVVDILSVAESARRGVDVSIPEIEVSLIASRRGVTSGSGMVVTATRTLRELDDLDILILPALGTITSEDTEAALHSADTKSIVAALARVRTGQTRVAGACTGVFPLAETGLLDGRTVTTSWFLVPTSGGCFLRSCSTSIGWLSRTAPSSLPALHSHTSTWRSQSSVASAQS
jgi:transcriptional regulator GlxA family with amidase domain